MIAEPGALASVLLVAAVYLRGVRAVWTRAGQGHGVREWQAACFAAGLLVTLAALETPLDSLSEALFAAHMVQHLLLMLVAAPLLALGAPLIALAWGLPPDVRRGTARLCRLLPTRPSVAFTLHVVAIWAWHIPSLYEAALSNRAIHAAEHASFLATGALFWWVVVRRGYGLGVLYVFGLAVQSTILGALLTFARAPWYTSHLSSTAAWGLTALEDQQLAGVIMWVPGGLIYLVAALSLFGVWLSAGAGPAPTRSTPARRPAEPLASPEP